MDRKVEECVEFLSDHIKITTPYLDRHNDYFQIYVQVKDGEFILTDDGYVLGDLAMSGVEINTPNHKELLQAILNGFDVQLNGDALEVIVRLDNFSMRKHSLVQAMLAIDDLFYAMGILSS